MASVQPRLPAPTARVIAATITLALATTLAVPSPARTQTGSPSSSAAGLRVDRFSFAVIPNALRGPARHGQYAGVVGARATWLGYETGSGEIWVHPLKIARDLHLSFKIPEYTEPIDGAEVARNVEVTPGRTTVTYSHGAFVVKEHILAPRDFPGILILLEADPVVQLEIQVAFQPVLQYAWPGGFGGQYLFWDAENHAFVLSESLRERNAVIGSPWATEASAHPAHQLAEAPSVFVIPVDPERAKVEFIPIAITGGIEPTETALSDYRELIARAPAVAREVSSWGSSLRDEGLSLTLSEVPLPTGGPAAGAPPPDEAPSTPRWKEDDGLMLPIDPGTALEWAKLNLAEQRVCNPDLGCGAVAGWGPSGTGFRPGFGWFFGGDAAINSLAMDATGQWPEVAEALRFLATYQREDGKIPHEISQSAGRLPWFEAFPYAYYHADTTPFWMLSVWNYWHASGDDSLLEELWPAYLRAYDWCLSVETDGDGIIENTTGGLGAIEVGGLGEGLHQDIYLAAVWITALQGTADMAEYRGESALATEARSLFATARASLNREYWLPELGYHAFGILQGGGTNGNLTAWPGTALSFGLLNADEAEGTLAHLAGDAISSSWGARLLSTQSELFDPLHYNNGAVWPFMTGFVAWGQYRYRRPWAGYPLLRALWALNHDWSLGRHPENLSGAFYQTMDATVPHQFFATSMLVTPFARGLLGWDPDAPHGRAVLAPLPPPTWSEFSVENLRVGSTRIVFHYVRLPFQIRVELRAQGPPVDLEYVQGLPPGARDVIVANGTEQSVGRGTEGSHDQQHHLGLHLTKEVPVQLTFRWAGGLEVMPYPAPRLLPGSVSGGVRILDFVREGEGWLLTLEGEGDTRGSVLLRGEEVTADGGMIAPISASEDMYDLSVEFPEGPGRVLRAVRLAPSNHQPKEQP